MKRFVAALLATALLFALAACGKKPAPPERHTDWDSEYERAFLPTVGENEAEIFEKATNMIMGVKYEPLALIATQAVAGTNYCFLSKASVYAPEEKSYYAILYIYQDLSGEAVVSEIYNCGAEAGSAGLAGGWEQLENPYVTPEIREVFEKAAAADDEQDYDPIACVATQVVAGRNYCLLCEITDKKDSEDKFYAMVYVYADLQGGAEITDTELFKKA
ncbi:MAG: hypothetical protein J5562_00450 [Clostridia bacterium]|nr:hypothetical protein [Clostridia bacterium]